MAEEQPHHMFFDGPHHMLPNAGNGVLFKGDVPRIGEEVFQCARLWVVERVCWKVLEFGHQSIADVYVKWKEQQ